LSLFFYTVYRIFYILQYTITLPLTMVGPGGSLLTLLSCYSSVTIGLSKIVLAGNSPDSGTTAASRRKVVFFLLP
jgi:hypothetical protein